MFGVKKKKNLGDIFTVGDKVEVDSSYAASNRDRDCTGQAVIASVEPKYNLIGVSFPNMPEGWKWYWINPKLITKIEE